MNLQERLPQIGRALFSQTTLSTKIDAIECPVCYQYYLPNEKIPIICCSKNHVFCEPCLRKIIKQQKNADQYNGISLSQRQPARCPFCRGSISEEQRIDTQKLSLCKELETIVKNIKKVSEEVRVFLLKDCERKVRKQYEIRIKELQKREEQVERKQQNIVTTIQAILDKQHQLQVELNEANQKIKQLTIKNNIKIQQAGESNIKPPSQRKNQVAPSKSRRNIRTIYFDNGYFKQIKFCPLKDQGFSDNFMEILENEKYVIQIQERRKKELARLDSKKIVIHNQRQFFDYRREEDRQICFSVRNLNSKVMRFGFGLVDETLHPIKGAQISLYVYISSRNIYEQSNSQEGTITCYVDLVKRKLSINSGVAQRSDYLPKNCQIQKFTVCLYYLDSDTRYELNEQQQ